MDVARQLWQGLIQLVAPAVCHVCHVPLSPSAGPLCPDCHLALTHDPHETCPRCASTVGPYTDLSRGCPACRTQGYAFAGTVRLGVYDGVLKEAVLRTKSSPGEVLAEVLGELFVRQAEGRLRALGGGVVVPVPQHWWRQMYRGFNPSERVACSLARGLGLPCRPGLLSRPKATEKQTLQVSAAQRRKNLRDAFRARGAAALRGKTVLLVDDVMTTGSTAHEAARALRAGGAARVVVAVLARTVLN